MTDGPGWLLAPMLPLVSFLWSINDLRGLCSSSLLSLADLALSFGSIVPVLFHCIPFPLVFPYAEAVPCQGEYSDVLRVGKAHPASAP